MNGMNILALLVITSPACSGLPAPSSDETVLATAFANPIGSMTSSAEHATPTVSLEQDTAKTVTRRIWADADLYSLSRDGRYAALTDWTTGDLAIRDMATGEVRHLTHNSSPYDPGEAADGRFSPDGRWVAYSWYDEDEPAYYKLGVVDVEGANPRLIYRERDTRWIEVSDWSPDGRWILASRSVGNQAEILLVSAEDGTARVLKTFEDPPSRVTFSPDGRYFAYDAPRDDPDDSDIFVVDVVTGEENVLIMHPANDMMLGWAPDGKHILFRSDRSGTPGAWLLPVADGKASGTPWLVKPDMWRTRGVGFTDDGRYFYRVSTGRRDVFVATFDPESRSVVGTPTAITGRSLDNASRPQWSPDGSHIAYTLLRGEASAVNRIVVRSLETGDVREFDLGVPGRVGLHSWMEDGRSLVARASNPSIVDNRITLYRLDIQTGRKEVLLRPFGQRDPLAYVEDAPGGASVLYMVAEKNPRGQAAFRIVWEELATGDTTVLFQTPYGQWGQILGMKLSPDHQTLAFGYSPTVGSDPKSLVLLPVTGEEPQVLPIEGVRAIAWMPDGRALLFQRFVETGPVWNTWYLDLSEGEPRRIGLTVSGRPGLDVHPDGRRITYTSGKVSSELWVMENFLPQPRR